MPTETKKILVVEDDKFLRDIVDNHLIKAGYAIINAASGEEAIKAALEEHPDLIILDIVLSGISGLDVMARLHENAETKKIPFIVFTNSDEDSSVTRGHELGAVKYLVKAVSTPEKIVHEINDFFKN